MVFVRTGSVLIFTLGLASCSVGHDVSRSSEATSQSPAAPVQRQALVDCVKSIDNGAQLPADYSRVLGSVALPTSKSAKRALQVGHRAAEPAPNFFAKTGLLVQPRTNFAIEVNHPQEAAALIGWGSSNEQPVGRISSSGCEGDAWIAFAGGVLVREPMCVELTVTVDEASEVVKVGAGAPCDGQQPPL